MAQKRRDQKGRLLREGESQRADGRYMFRYIDNNGERKTEYSWRLVETDAYLSGKKKELSLREKETLIQKDLLDGINITGGEITLNELFDKYMRSKKRLRDNVKETYKSLYNKHIKASYLGNMMVKSISKNDILNVYEEMFDAMLSNGTIHNLHNNVLFPTLQLAVENDWIRKNPANHCLDEYPYDSSDKRNALSIDEQKRFLEFMQKDKVYAKYYPIAALILETALRRGEVLGLTWNDVDIKKRTLSINHQLHYYSIKGKYVFKIGKPKTSSGVRVIPLSNEALKILQDIKEKEYFPSVLSGVSIDGYKNFIFLNKQRDNVLIPRNFGDALAKMCEKYNKKELLNAKKEQREPELLPVITPHILRHTACTRMAENGMDVKVLQAVMGHKNVTVTMNVYNHVDLHRLTREFERLDGLEKVDAYWQ